MPFEITDFRVVPRQQNKFVKRVQLHYSQDGNIRTWEAVKSYKSVSVLLYHIKKSLSSGQTVSTTSLHERQKAHLH